MSKKSNAKMETTKPISQENEIQNPSWWIWSAWITRKHSNYFVYGCAAQCLRPSGWIDEASILFSSENLVIHQSIVTEEVFNLFKIALDSGTIHLEKIYGKTMPEQKIKASRLVFQECLGHGKARTELYYTLPEPISLAGDHVNLEHLLATLQNELNLPFKDTYANRLGNFEVFHLSPWLESKAPVLSEFSRTNQLDLAGPQTLKIYRTPEFAQKKHFAHLICYNNKDVIVDRIIALPTNLICQMIQLPESPDSFKLWLFEEDDGAVLFYEHSTFIRQMNMVMGVMGHSVTIEDNLSARAKQQDGDMAKRIITVPSISPQRSIIGGNSYGSWKAFSQQMENFVLQRTAEVGEDKWFPKGIEGEIGVIAHLNQMLDGGKIQKAVIVDPWFGSQSVDRLILRLSSRNFLLTIITSWVSTNPDTNKAVTSRINPTAELEVSLNNVRHLVNPTVVVSNLVDGGDQAFHDRYLLIYPYEGVAKTFLLSNSINKMAGNWPFSMSLLTPSISLKIQHYIEGLCEGIDNARGRELKETFRWASNEK